MDIQLEQQSVTDHAELGEAEEVHSNQLNPEAEPFNVRDKSLVYREQLHPNLDSDWALVTEVRDGKPRSGTQIVP